MDELSTEEQTATDGRFGVDSVIARTRSRRQPVTQSYNVLTVCYCGSVFQKRTMSPAWVDPLDAATSKGA